MELIKYKERTTGKDLLRAIRSMGGEIRTLNKYSKWVEVRGGKVLDNMELIEVTIAGMNIVKYALLDPLNRFACACTDDKNEILSFLNKEGWELEAQVDDDDDEAEEE